MWSKFIYLKLLYIELLCVSIKQIFKFNETYFYLLTDHFGKMGRSKFIFIASYRSFKVKCTDSAMHWFKEVSLKMDLKDAYASNASLTIDRDFLHLFKKC